MKRSILLTILILMLLSPPFVFGQAPASSCHVMRRVIAGLLETSQ